MRLEATMDRKPKIAIVCQGGGSQTAFTAGALKALFEAGVHDGYEIVSLSGITSWPPAPCQASSPPSSSMVAPTGAASFLTIL